MMHNIRIGSGAGFAGDRIEPALDLIAQGDLDYIVFECLAERTIALAQKNKLKDPLRGYDELLETRMEKVLPLAYKNKVKVISNMGAANPVEAARIVARIAKEKDLAGLKIVAVEGDDVLPLIQDFLDLPILETGELLSTLANKIISANAYLSSAPIVQALREGADIIITGRVADPSLFLAPLIYEFNWSSDDYEKMGRGTLVGHLLECAGQISGGYFSDPGTKDVDDLWDLGFPYAEVDPDGHGYISKIENSGGLINTATCTEQLLYEIHDPSRYITPDCIADFSKVTFTELQKNKVSFQEARGRQATDSYKVSVGFENGFMAEASISYGGSNCMARAHQAIEIVRKRLDRLSLPIEDIRFDALGVNSILPNKNDNYPELNEVRIRVAARVEDEQSARLIVHEIESLYTNGPAAGGGVEKKVSELISIRSVLIPKSLVQTQLKTIIT